VPEARSFSAVLLRRARSSLALEWLGWWPAVSVPFGEAGVKSPLASDFSGHRIFAGKLTVAFLARFLGFLVLRAVTLRACWFCPFRCGSW